MKNAMKPAFLPLNKEYYIKFKQHLKHDEYRLYGGRFVEKNFETGRPIVVSCGYGKHDRTVGVIEGFFLKDLHELPAEAQRDIIACYGDKAKVQPIAVIRINLDA